MKRVVKYTCVGLIASSLVAGVAFAVSAGDTGKVALSGLTVAQCYDAANEQRDVTNVANPNCHMQINTFACYPKPAGCVCDAIVTAVSGDCGGVAMFGPWY